MAFSAKLFVVVVAALFSQELITNARSSLEKMGEELTKLTGSTPEELKSAMEAKSQELQTRAQNVIEEVKKQVETHGAELPDKTRQAFNEIVTHLNQTIDNLKSQAPGTMDEMSAVQQRFSESFKSSMETFLEETKKLAKAAGDESGDVHDHVATFARNAFNQGMEILTAMNTQFKAAVEHASSS
ncbi:hypothetical protein J437_LFUL007636 [Ladona fulva]|uniref:Apolipophorin-III n=1 Tax=Ladona fulva TaxID=123851 RepID=A0A8K0K7E1_LADFU|nr:hypothetical protein J437_LFUL007636 [Ladona fulva]